MAHTSNPLRFTPLTRENKPDMPPASEIKVYVLVEKDKAPVFTKVVR